MVEDKDLKRAVDYSEGQKMAAYRVLGEIVNFAVLAMSMDL